MASEGTHKKENITARPCTSCAPSPVSLPVCSVAFEASQAAAKVPVIPLVPSAVECSISTCFTQVNIPGLSSFHLTISSFKRTLKDAFYAHPTK